MISPTNKGVRNDPAGLGHYGARRGSRRHLGTDYLCSPGQDVVSPINGKIERLAFPYQNDPNFCGVLIRGSSVTVKMFYFDPFLALIGQSVTKGQRIGVAQDITAKYEGGNMKPHIHVEIDSIDPEIFISKI